ncbi:glycosyltransferase family 4 protein [Peribacillus loiseleuriae]|uniref:Glycosyl transferase n=1 Tax=Peribacillus loiseleuriae TaxID=1679170 RepID=A0A0K9GWB8_9BACI|nr:glycosyltransferase family 1 protein [Peribacillus loiseleuriae]KMY50950.1 glycosyl transferase [Peribacillus loiseleuriae]
MKIAIFTDTFDPDINGVARTLKRFTDYLGKQNISFKIFAPKSQSDEYVTSHIHRFKSLSFFLYPECRLAFPNLSQVKSELQDFSPDLIHVATPFNIGLCGAYYAKKLNIPLVGSYHTDFDHYLQFYNMEFLSKLLWRYMNWFHRPFKKIFVPSNDTLEHLKRHGFKNLELWGRGVDCNLYHPYYEKKAVRKQYGIQKKYLLTYVGRLAPEKDVKTLLAIAKSIPAYINEYIQWVIIGDGPMREELENEAPENMMFTGYLRDEKLAEIYAASDVFVFPSSTETFGNVVLEALASGTPVICANAGGVKHIIQEGITGYLCQSGNAQAFTDSILHLIHHVQVRDQMGIEGRKYAVSQKWDTIFEQLLWQYMNVIEEPKQQKFA